MLLMTSCKVNDFDLQMKFVVCFLIRLKIQVLFWFSEKHLSANDFELKSARYSDIKRIMVQRRSI